MSDRLSELPRTAPFAARVARSDPSAGRADSVRTLMVNVGLRCDMACPHCHHAASPARTEAMSRATMLDALCLAALLVPATIDVTGGEPSLWPHLREFVQLARGAGHPLRVRTNLVSLARPELEDLPAFLAEHGVALLGSLPGTCAADVAEQRGDTWDRSVGVLRALARLGYGRGGGLVLDLAHNPPVGELPASEPVLAETFRAALEPLGVRFDAVRSLANVPVGRFARQLESGGAYDAHLGLLARAFNPGVLGGLACRSTIDVRWDGALFDCDFNMGAGLAVVDGPRTLAEALALGASGADVPAVLASRRIALGEHCFACAVGAGSS